MNVNCACQDKIWPLLIIGAGPAGIEAAAYAKKLGVDALILEASDRIAPNLEAISHLPLYPEPSRILSPLGLSYVPQAGRLTSLNAGQYREAYLRPLAEASNIAIRFRHWVRTIGRRGAWKTTLELNARKATPFKLLVETSEGETTLLAEKVVDATGTYNHPLPAGETGIEAIGETRYRDQIEYGVVDFDAQFETFNNCTTVLLGDSYAAFCSCRSFFEQDARWGSDTRLICLKETATDRVTANQELNQLKERYQNLAYHDELTGVSNRLKINEFLAQQREVFLRNQTPFSIILFDVDHFKKFNDHYGHLVGDEVLVALSQRIDTSVRGSDIFGRWGGEEFLIIAPNTELKHACQLAEKLRRLIASTPLVSQASVTISLGIAQIQPEETLDQLIGRADKSLYQTKQQGRNLRVCLEPSERTSS